MYSRDDLVINYVHLDLAAIASACIEATPEDEHASLLQRLHEILPDLGFQLVLTRSGWYRIGGVVDANGCRIANNLSDWVEAEVEVAGDVAGLHYKYARESLYATRLNGKTHYLVAQTGARPQDFIQLEVEEVQEVLARPLFEEDSLPELIEEIVDPLDFTRVEAEPVADPQYLFRRVLPIADYLDELIDKMDKIDNKPPVLRIISDWERSSAGESAIFSEHWVLSFREYTDGYGEPRFYAKPITTYCGEIPVIDENNVPRGSKLANFIHDFDRQVGYPMAWFFFMLTHKEVSHQIAESIHKDLMGAYAYLPARDIKVLQDWYGRGYGV